MNESPTQSAEQEQAQRQAAFQRARAKLASARGAEERRRKTIPHPQVFRALRWLLVAILIGVIVVWTFDPATMDPATWSEDQTGPALIAILLWMVGYGGWWIVRRLRMHPAERVLHDFYASVDSDSLATGMEECVIQADFDAAPRKAPAFRPEEDVMPCISGAAEINWYWENLFKPAGKPRCRPLVRSVKLMQVEDDLYLASVKLRIVRRASQNLFIGMLFPLIFLTMMLDTEEVPFLHSQAGAGLIIGVTAVLITLGSYWFTHRKPGLFRVQKLVVSCGEQWRLFCGDWEGWEEVDLSWLDETSS
jgi:hypothetical protein